MASDPLATPTMAFATVRPADAAIEESATLCLTSCIMCLCAATGSEARRRRQWSEANSVFLLSQLLRGAEGGCNDWEGLRLKADEAEQLQLCRGCPSGLSPISVGMHYSRAFDRFLNSFASTRPIFANGTGRVMCSCSQWIS